MPSGKTILSIQSHVAYGYVGNRAAAFPLQRRGHEVIVVNTVQFSNHTGYGSWTGQIFDTAHINDLLQGLEARGLYSKIDAVLTGYIGSSALGGAALAAVKKIRAVQPAVIYGCDPVMGDHGRGFFTDTDIQDFFKRSAVPAADLLTPNQFELTALTGIEVDTLAAARRACGLLHDSGPGTILLTSLETDDTPAGSIQMLASRRQQDAYIVTTPKLDFAIAPNGAGDLAAALFTSALTEGCDLATALSQTAASIYGVLAQTYNEGRRELALISAQDELMHPSREFPVQKI